jgi:uroporphyrinogen-III decarboxylase
MSCSSTLTSRERVLKAIAHQEPDRIPIDLGGSITSGISAYALVRLRNHLGMKRPVKVYDVFQMLGEVEMDLVEKFHIDVLPVEPLSLFFGMRRKDYKPWKLPDGTEILMPGNFNVEIDGNGDYLLREEGNPSKPIVARMPKGGFYFEDLSLIHFVDDFTPPPLEKIKGQRKIKEEDLEFMVERARLLRNETDKALLLGPWPYVGLVGVGSIPNFLMLIATEKNYVKELMHLREEETIENLKLLWKNVGENVDIVIIDGWDFGSQQGELISPEDFLEIYAPHYRSINAWVHQNTTWKTWQHICGSITKILPILVDTGLDILNPVQVSAKGMDPSWLKREFGSRLTFWGGGINTQSTLPFGTPEEVENEVKEMIRIFGPGGGFVFAAVHNIQPGTPPKNIEVMLQAVIKYGQYPLNPELMEEGKASEHA